MNKPTLLVLAAGMGSRYGGLKQIDPLGPNGEIIIDYSVYDAILAGFGKVVFVIKRELADTFHQMIGSRFEGKIQVEYAYQEMEDLPAGFSVPEGRVKPWGTGHAVYAARKQLEGPFGIIGSDDFFGRETFLKLGDFCAHACDGTHLGMVGYRLENTLSDSGSVSRGVCAARNGFLQTVVERLDIRREADGTVTCADGEGRMPLKGSAPVSLNVWALHSDVLADMEMEFTAWLREGGGDPLKREYYLPAFVDGLVRSGRATVRMMDTGARWFGVTHREDKPQMQSALLEMHREGVYPPLR